MSVVCKKRTGAACGPFMRSTCSDWRGPRLAASAQVIPSSVAARKLDAASAHSARAAPLAAQASSASSTSRGEPSFSWPYSAGGTPCGKAYHTAFLTEAFCLMLIF